MILELLKKPFKEKKKNKQSKLQNNLGKGRCIPNAKLQWLPANECKIITFT